MFFFGSLARWWHNRRRNIFKYYDGSMVRRADPYVVGQELERRLPDYGNLLRTLAEKPSSVPPGRMRAALVSQKDGAAKTLAAVFREVFGLKPLTENSGVTEGEVINILAAYFLFMEELAHRAGHFR